MRRADREFAERRGSLGDWEILPLHGHLFDGGQWRVSRRVITAQRGFVKGAASAIQTTGEINARTGEYPAESVAKTMPRWEHGSEDRLKKAAIELFEEQGFEKTSVIEIAERARVATRTFFRYFSDKREVLFAEAEVLRAALVKGVLQAPDLAQPLQLVTDVLAQFD